MLKKLLNRLVELIIKLKKLLKSLDFHPLGVELYASLYDKSKDLTNINISYHKDTREKIEEIHRQTFKNLNPADKNILFAIALIQNCNLKRIKNGKYRKSQSPLIGSKL